jgi:enoyl-CoA hydratase
LSHLHDSITDGVMLLELDRPPANAMDVELLGELCDVLDRLAADPPRAVVLAGRSGFFSGGVDLKAVPGYGPADQRTMVERINRMAIGAYSLPCPVVAAVTGHAVAGGLVLALGADVRIASARSPRCAPPPLGIRCLRRGRTGPRPVRSRACFRRATSPSSSSPSTC